MGSIKTKQIQTFQKIKVIISTFIALLVAWFLLIIDVFDLNLECSFKSLSRVLFGVNNISEQVIIGMKSA